MLIVKVPHVMAAVGFRAYAEHLRNGSVLDWALSRLLAAAPPGVRLACMCDFESERDRLQAAYDGKDDVGFLYGGEGSEAQQCRLMMDRHHVARIVVAGLGHAAAPVSFLRDLLQIHRRMNAELTDITDTVFVDPFYIVESSLIDEILNAILPQVPDAVVPAATLLREAHRRDPRLARDFTWLRIDLGKRLGIVASRWPETIAIRSGRDLDILRQAVAQAKDPLDVEDTFIDAWKRAATAVHQHRRQRALLRTEGPARTRGDRIRVLYGSSSPAFTGAQQSLCHLIGALDRDRFDPLALVPYDGTFANELRRHGATVICPSDDFGGANIENLHFTRYVVREYAPDIVHSNHSIGLPLVCATVAADIPLIQHVRVQWPRDLRELIYAADAVIAVSHFVRNRIAELDIDLGKVEVIWNGVDINEFPPDPLAKSHSRRRFRIAPDEFVIVMIARLAPNKRHDLAIDALATLRRATGRGHLLLVGDFDGDREYSRRISALIQQRDLASHTSVVDFLPDIRPALYASDVMVLPSEDEPLSRAVLEGMAVGLPVVVADSGGTKEVIDHGRTGLVVARGSHGQLAAALQDLAERPEWAQALGTAATHKIRSSLTAARCAEQTMSVYERVLSVRRPRLRPSGVPEARWQATDCGGEGNASAR